MYYQLELAIPPNTTKDNPQYDALGVTSGNIISLSIYFPWGCAGLVGVQILRNTYQLMPLTRGEWLIGNDIYIVSEYNFSIDVDPYELNVVSFNNDDTYNHHPIVSATIARYAVSANLDAFLRTL
jgi:hypothetical protein